MNKRINSFTDFWSAIKSISHKDDEFLVFRGHSDNTYKLQPPAFRVDKKNSERTSYRKIMIEYPEEFQTRDHVSTLVKMQHYGSDTRLLDFTMNPLMSLYFASEAQNDKDGQVIVCKVKKSDMLHHTSDKALMLACLPCFSDADKEELRKLCHENLDVIKQSKAASSKAMIRFLHEIRRECPAFECAIIGEHLLNNYFVRTYKDNERIKIQDGLFLFFGLRDKAADKDSSLNITRIDIAKDAKKNILEDLQLMRITTSTVYPGLERRAKEIMNKRVNWVKIGSK